MLLTLGSHTFDVTARALVVAVVSVAGVPLADVCRAAERLVDEGADLLELAGDAAEDVRGAVAALGTAVAVPLAVASEDASVAAAGMAAGAVLSGDARVALDTGSAALVRTLDQAEAAARAGLAPDRIVLDLTPRLRPQPDEVALGFPLLASACRPAVPTAGEDDAQAVVVASAALAVSTGCRLVRTRDVRAVRRVRDVLAAVLAEAEPQG